MNKPLQFTRPMLAAPLLPANDPHTDASILAAMQKLKYPVLATLKKDGIRAIRLNGSLLSRTLKPIPNRSIRERSLFLPGGFDMELWNPGLTYDEVESIVMSREHPKSDHINFHILDWFGSAVSYAQRCDNIYKWVTDYKMGVDEASLWPEFQMPTAYTTAERLFDYFVDSERLSEGICFRTPNSPYKQGRSTLKEQYLVKLCRFITAECKIVGFVEQMSNENLDSRNGVGMMDRSSEQDGLVPKNTLGAFKVRQDKPCPFCRARINAFFINMKQEDFDKIARLGCEKCDFTGQMTFSIGTGVGLTNAKRKEIWDNRDCYCGKQITYKSKHHGEKDLPRSPIMKGFRLEIDL